LTGFGTTVWQTVPRDQSIGWSHEQRKINLRLVVNNARFLIFPWIKSKNLVSRILSLTARNLPDDWGKRYNIRPVLMEIFVETKRFSGTCYEAANWRLCGQTKGRVKLGPAGKINVPIKDVLVYYLYMKFKKISKN